MIIFFKKYVVFSLLYLGYIENKLGFDRSFMISWLSDLDFWNIEKVGFVRVRFVDIFKYGKVISKMYSKSGNYGNNMFICIVVEYFVVRIIWSYK